MRLHGPQSDRERNLGRGLVGASIPTRNGPSVADKLNNPDRDLDSQTVEAEIGRLQRENVLITDQLRRSLQVIKAYQLKYPSSHIELRTDDENDELPPWNTSADAFLPLFDAYDTRIKELEDMVHLKTLELSKFQSLVDSITTENEQLRELQVNQVHISAVTHARGNYDAHGSKFGIMSKENLDTNTVLHNEIIAELNERIDILMAENGLLAEQKLSLSSELEHHHSELNARTQDVKQLQTQNAQIKKECSQLKHNLQQVESDRDEAAAQALSFSEALSKVDAQYSSLQEQLTLSKQREHESTKQYQELKTDLQTAIKAHEEDTYETLKSVRVLENRIRELQVALLEKTQENDIAQETVRKLKRECQVTRQDAEAMLQVMSGLEKQLAEYAAREGDIEKLAKDSKIKIAEAMSARDQALLRAKILHEDLTRSIEENKKLSKEQFVAVERAIESANEKSKEQIASAEKEMKILAEIIAKLRTEYEASIRESKAAVEHVDRLRRQHQDETKVLEEGQNMMQLRLKEALSMREAESQRRSEVQETNKDLRLTIDKLRSQVDSLKVQTVQSEKLRKAETSLLKTNVRDLEAQLHDKAKQLESAQQELTDLQLNFQSMVSSSESKTSDELAAYRQNSLEAEKARRELEEELANSEARSRHVVEKIKEANSRTVDQLTTQLEADNEKLRQIQAKSSDFEEQVAALTEENGQLLRVLEDAKSTIASLQSELDEAKDRVDDLTEQLISTTTGSGAMAASGVTDNITSQIFES